MPLYSKEFFHYTRKNRKSRLSQHVYNRQEEITCISQDLTQQIGIISQGLILQI